MIHSNQRCTPTNLCLADPFRHPVGHRCQGISPFLDDVTWLMVLRVRLIDSVENCQEKIVRSAIDVKFYGCLQCKAAKPSSFCSSFNDIISTLGWKVHNGVKGQLGWKVLSGWKVPYRVKGQLGWKVLSGWKVPNGVKGQLGWKVLSGWKGKMVILRYSDSLTLKDFQRVVNTLELHVLRDQ